MPDESRLEAERQLHMKRDENEKNFKKSLARFSHISLLILSNVLSNGSLRELQGVDQAQNFIENRIWLFWNVKMNFRTLEIEVRYLRLYTNLSLSTASIDIDPLTSVNTHILDRAEGKKWDEEKRFSDGERYVW